MRRDSTDIGQRGRQPTPTVQRGDMKKHEPYPLCEEVKGSNHDKRKITIPEYENELVLQVGPAYRSLQE